MKSEVFNTIFNISFKDVSALTGGMLTIVASSTEMIDIVLKHFAQIGGAALLTMGLIHKIYQIIEVRRNLKKK